MVPIVSNESVGRLSALVPVATSLRRAYVRELGANPEDTCRIGFGKGVEQGPQLVGIIGSSFENWVMLTHEIDESQYRRSRIICQAGSIVGAYRVGGGNPHMSPVELQSLSFQLKRTRGCS